MGSKYWIRTNEKRVFPLQTIDYTDYYVNSFIEYIKLMVLKKGKILFIQKQFSSQVNTRKSRVPMGIGKYSILLENKQIGEWQLSKVGDMQQIQKQYYNEMMWRAEEIGKLDTCNKNRLMTNFRKTIEEILEQFQ